MYVSNPLRWGNQPVHIISPFNLITFTLYMTGGVTRHMLPHLFGIPHLHVNRPLVSRMSPNFPIPTPPPLPQLLTT